MAEPIDVLFWFMLLPFLLIADLLHLGISWAAPQLRWSRELALGTAVVLHSILLTTLFMSGRVSPRWSVSLLSAFSSMLDDSPIVFSVSVQLKLSACSGVCALCQGLFLALMGFGVLLARVLLILINSISVLPYVVSCCFGAYVYFVLDD